MRRIIIISICFMLLLGILKVFSETSNVNVELLEVSYGRDENSKCIEEWLFDGKYEMNGEILKEKEKIFNVWSKENADNVDWVTFINMNEFAEKRLEFVIAKNIQCCTRITTENKCEPSRLTKYAYSKMKKQNVGGYMDIYIMPSLFLYNSNDPECTTQKILFYYLEVPGNKAFPYYEFFTVENIISNSYVHGISSQTTIYTASRDNRYKKESNCDKKKDIEDKITLTQIKYFDERGAQKSIVWTAWITTSDGAFLKLEGVPLFSN